MSRSRRDPSSLSAMRRTAGGLLLAMTGLYVGTHLLAPPAGAWGYVRAFAEAAMIGGLADWFAVTAIFRQPFGLPIPHTGVIPRHQGRIADAVGAFIRDHFLEPQLVSRRLETADLSEAAARWLNVPSQASALAAGLTSLIKRVGLLSAFGGSKTDTVGVKVMPEMHDTSCVAWLFYICGIYHCSAKTAQLLEQLWRVWRCTIF